MIKSSLVIKYEKIFYNLKLTIKNSCLTQN